MDDRHGGDVREYRVAADFLFIESLFETWSNAVSLREQDSPLRCKSFPICEPLKCRVITQGDAQGYYEALVLQKLMHRQIRKYPVFEFTGTPISEEAICKAFPIGQLQEGDEIVSGDYDAATDNVKLHYSSYCWKKVANCLGLTDTWYEVGQKALTRHRLYWKIRKNVHCMSAAIAAGATECADQAGGQPMGSPMSFPILCILNLAAWCLAYGISPKRARSYPLRINGDDIAFFGPAVNSERWWKVNREVGFLPSLGKNYCSDLNRHRQGVPLFLNMNSTTYVARSETPESDEGNWKQVPYVNLGLLFGTDRKGITAGEKKYCPYWEYSSNFQTLIQGFRPKEQARLRLLFLEYNPIPRWMPVDLPSALGGPELLIDGEDWSEQCRLFVGYFACCDPVKQAKLARTVSLHPSNMLKDAMSRVQPYQWELNLRLPDKEGVCSEPARRDNPVGIGLLGSYLLGMGDARQKQKCKIGVYQHPGFEDLSDDLNLAECIRYHAHVWQFYKRLRKDSGQSLYCSRACHPADPETVDRYASMIWTRQAIVPAWRPESHRSALTFSELNRQRYISDNVESLLSVPTVSINTTRRVVRRPVIRITRTAAN